MRKIAIFISTAALAVHSFVFALPAAAETSCGPGIFQMADGMYYHVSSGSKAFACGAVREMAGLPAQIPEATPPAPSYEEGVKEENPPADSPLKKAIIRGREMLQSRIDQAKAAGKKPKLVANCPASVFVTLAVWNEANDDIKKIVVRKQGAQAAIYSSEVDATVTIRRSNGVNSDYAVSGPYRQVVAVDYTVCMPHPSGNLALEDVVYTPYSRGLHTPELVASGKKIFDEMIEKAYADLEGRGTMSRTFTERPLTQVIPRAFAKSIIIIEHLSPGALSGEAAERSVETMYVTLGTNGDDSYAYSLSPAGAKGMVQFIPSTYKLMTRFTGLGLDPNFETAMANPTNAIKAQVAYLDTELASMPLSVKDLYYVDMSRVLEYLAAAYNGGGLRVRRAIATYGEAWSSLHPRNPYALRAETVDYVQKLRDAKTVISPPPPPLQAASI